MVTIANVRCGKRLTARPAYVRVAFKKDCPTKADGVSASSVGNALICLHFHYLWKGYPQTDPQ